MVDAVTTALLLPDVVGVPEISPVVSSSVNPSGSAPPVTDHVAPSRPIPEIVAEYDSSTTPAGTPVVVIDAAHSGANVVDGPIVVGTGLFDEMIHNTTFDVQVEMPLAVRVIRCAPGLDGVPEIAPVDSSRLRPSGNEPFDTSHVAPSRFTPDTVALYGSSTDAAGNESVVIYDEHAGTVVDGAGTSVVAGDSVVVVSGGANVTMKYKVTDTTQPDDVVAETTALVTPSFVGVPEITPVVSFKVRPFGSAPPVTDQVALLRPEPEIVAEYNSSTTPAGTPVVVIEAEHAFVVVGVTDVGDPAFVVVVAPPGTHVWLRMNSVSDPYTDADAPSRVSAVGVNTYACLGLGCEMNVVTDPALLKVAVSEMKPLSFDGSTKCQPYANPSGELGQSPCWKPPLVDPICDAFTVAVPVTTMLYFLVVLRPSESVTSIVMSNDPD